MRYDVIVVGAGPAGSTTARECASRGLSVLLLDRAEFPRDKPCGGGVNVRAARLLPFDLTPVAERTIRGLRVSVRGQGTFVRYSSEPLTYLTQRRRLDAFLADRARTAGATLVERAAVRAVEGHAGWVTVRAGSAVYEGKALVAADGANGQTARRAGLRIPRDAWIALEGNVTPDSFPDEWRDSFGMDLGRIPGGYGWLFPKGDHLNIGVGGAWIAGTALRTRLETMVRSYGYDPAHLWGVRGHPLPVRRPGADLVRGNVVAVGDSAGMVDPLSGEGIFAALWSGGTAARHIVEFLNGDVPNLEGYRREVERDLVPELAVSGQLHELLHMAPALWIGVLRRSGFAWGTLSRLIRGDTTYCSAKRRFLALRVALDASAGALRWRRSLLATRAGGDARFSVVLSDRSGAG